MDLMKNSGISINKVCLLDPKAEQELSPEDGDSFEWFLFGVRNLPWSYQNKKKETQNIQRESSVNCPACNFNCTVGSILFKGDDPPRDRTATLRVHGFPSRRLGPVQMTTDTALGVTKLVVADKIPLANVPYIVCFPKRISNIAVLILKRDRQDHPTIRFNAKESVQMPFRKSGDITFSE